MRKPRDFYSELKALEGKAKLLKERKILQLGELVIATGADMLDPETLAGALLKTMEANDAPRREVWRKRGAEFFQGKSRKGTGGTEGNSGGAQTSESGSAST